ncbi:hypothetical protein HN512_02510 [Candidatus Peregrinibacteria bacterium]|jgi:hypothetical protein|nr:hypothetical protein [Candidatus Peregrinibacteria bacterium]MBT3598685.1 hypothetical protein [Candidatus Peregrinibacteria bacterium]MBT4367514.1 hypothetical protein [Candidatus Peregrinibacteria bacterium]MBT4586033.1 hypothetical protein [Candidatus Peregrinibacteria bacterium]MBT6730461.1 hypothetical protein [Candidatus Peregrinibacteria bacterium]
MRRLHLVLAIIAIIITVQASAIAGLGLLIYQSTPNSVLARETFIGRIPGALVMVRAADRALNIFYRGEKPETPLPKYSLKIDKDDLKELKQALPTELPSKWYGNLFLQDEDKYWAKAIFSDSDGEEYEVKVRVRGDIFNHWAYNKKSWRVKFSKEKLFNGMREINFILPEDRGWFIEPLNVYRAGKFNLLHPPIRFVRVSVNGSGPLLYTEIEHWTKEMLEKQNRPGDVNIYNTGGGNSAFQQWDPAFDHLEYWDKYIEDPSGVENYEEVMELLSLSEEGSHLDPEYVNRLGAIMDIDKVIDWYVLSMLAGSRHVRDFNVRLFYDTSRGLFEPIPWDINMYNPRTVLAPPGNKLLNEIFRVPSLRARAHKRVWKYVQDDYQVSDDLDKVDELLNQIERAAYRDSLKINSNRQVKHQLEDRKKQVKSNIEWLKEELNTCEVLVSEAIPETSEQNRGLLLSMIFTVRGIADAEFKEIHLPDELVPLLKSEDLRLWKDTGNGVWGDEDIPLFLRLRENLDSSSGSVAMVEGLSSLLGRGDPELNENERVVSVPHAKHTFFLTSSTNIQVPKERYPLKVDIRNAITGNKADLLGEMIVDEQKFERLEESYISKEAFLNKYPFFTAGEQNTVILNGIHKISETLIIPSTVHLVIRPGSTLRMGAGVSIFSYAPVTMIGYKEAPIIISAERESEPWGVFVVVNAKDPSALQWVDISDGSEARLNGVLVTGMLSFQSSPVTIVDSVIRNAHGDDGLNLKNIYVDVNRVRFEKNSADGLDIDFALSGKVENSLFIGNGNDGLDISGSPIVIKNIEVDGSADKCISVGEQSTPLIHDATLKNCKYGLAVKDDSHAKVERVLFEKNDIAISAYVKKIFFKPPSVSVTDSTFRRNKENTVALSGAIIEVDSVK